MRVWLGFGRRSDGRRGDSGDSGVFLSSINPPSSAHVLDMSNSCLVHNLPLSTRRMSKKDCDALSILARPWSLLFSAKSEYQSINVVDILCAGHPCLTFSLRLF